MPITLAWDDDAKSIIRIDYHGVWQWTDFDQAIDESIGMAASTSQQVAIIINTLDGTRTPNGNSFSHMRRAMRLSPPNLTLTVTVGVRKGSFLKSAIMDIAFRFFPKAAERAAFADTVEEARTLIASRRQRQAVRAPTSAYQKSK